MDMRPTPWSSMVALVVANSALASIVGSTAVIAIFVAIKVIFDAHAHLHEHRKFSSP